MAGQRLAAVAVGRVAPSIFGGFVGAAACRSRHVLGNSEAAACVVAGALLALCGISKVLWAEQDAVVNSGWRWRLVVDVPCFLPVGVLPGPGTDSLKGNTSC